MALPLVAGAIAAGGSILGGLIGAGSAAADRQAAIDAWKKSVADYEAIGIPSAEAQQIALEEYQSAGVFSPEDVQALQLGETAMAGIQTDPQLKAAQIQSLSKLQDIGQNGYTLSDKAGQEKILGDIKADARGARGAIMQRAAQQGGYGKGSALVAQLMNQQAADTQSHQTGLQTAANAEQRALQGIMGAGDLAGKMRGQDYDEQARTAQARDAIAAWNAANTQGVRSGNVATRNNAQQFNLTNKQGLMNANTDTRNKTQVYNKELGQQNFNNQLALAQGKANARAGQASQLNANAQGTANMWSGIGSGVAQGAGAYGQYAADQQNRADQKEMFSQYLDRAYPKATPSYVDTDKDGWGGYSA